MGDFQEHNKHIEDKALDFESFSVLKEIDLERYSQSRFDSIQDKSKKSLNGSKKRILAGFIISLILTIILGAVGVITNKRSSKELEGLYNTSLKVRASSYELKINVMRMFGVIREIENDDGKNTDAMLRKLESLHNETITVKEGYEALSLLCGESELFKEDLKELKTYIEGWDETIAKSILFAVDVNIRLSKDNFSTYELMCLNGYGECIDRILTNAKEIADIQYKKIFRQSKGYDIYAISSTAISVILSILIIILVMKDATKAEKCVEGYQMELNVMLNQLMAMEGVLWQNLYELELEGERLKESEERYANSLDAANDAIWEIDMNTGEYFASDKWENVTSYLKPALFSRESILEKIDSMDVDKVSDFFDKKTTVFNEVIKIRASDNRMRWLNIKGKWNNNIITGSACDVTEKKKAEEYMEYLAYHDALTGIPNRAWFILEAGKAIERAHRTNEKFCILFMDIDNFKIVNDTYGHAIGDRMLAVIAERLKEFCQYYDCERKMMAARFGGDEFLMLIENIDNEDTVHTYTEAIMDLVREPIEIDFIVLHTTVSIGATIFPKDGAGVNVLLKHSDAALYKSKSCGKSRLTFYDQSMFQQVMRKGKIIDVLRHALTNKSVYMVYQAQWNTKTNCVESFEALMRLEDEITGLISPDEFIPLAEETRLIIPIGYWAIREVIECDIRLQKQGIETKSMSVNLSEVQLSEPDFVDKLKEIIKELDYDPSRLHLEITESILINNIEQKIEVFEAIREMGIKIELDDFGTGYSSLNYLRAIPLDVVKIDKCFVDGIGMNSEDEALIELVVQLTNVFGAEIVSEGVETQEQVEFLTAKGSTYLQGYYFSKPLKESLIHNKMAELQDLLLQAV